ncbi:MAG TPA: VCBS repeat-containing protein, partial [Tepidisphaeraceae bacterium]|nr:VCBS repeat-containing protein [Tepidisphaeraceae bacterium]
VEWEKAKIPQDERYWGPSVNLASVEDINRDGKDDLVFTNPDMYCVTSGDTGNFLLGPLTQMSIFNQPSQGLYTFPAILGEGSSATVALVGGHYFRAAMSIDAHPKWFTLPKPGEARCANEGFMRLRDGAWLMAFGRQNGKLACYNVADGKQRWELDLQTSCSDVTCCDIDGDGNPEFIFGTSHGTLYAVRDDAGKAKVIWKQEVGAPIGSPVLADMDGDGNTDIVIATDDGRVRLLGMKK